MDDLYYDMLISNQLLHTEDTEQHTHEDELSDDILRHALLPQEKLDGLRLLQSISEEIPPPTISHNQKGHEDDVSEGFRVLQSISERIPTSSILAYLKRKRNDEGEDYVSSKKKARQEECNLLASAMEAINTPMPEEDSKN